MEEDKPMDLRTEQAGEREMYLDKLVRGINQGLYDEGVNVYEAVGVLTAARALWLQAFAHEVYQDNADQEE